jgi:hypothetical protein
LRLALIRRERRRCRLQWLFYSRGRGNRKFLESNTRKSLGRRGLVFGLFNSGFRLGGRSCLIRAVVRGKASLEPPDGRKSSWKGRIGVIMLLG